MKPAFILTVLLTTITVSCDSDDTPNTQAPSVVLNAFQNRFPHSVESHWEETENIFEVEFEINDTDHKALIDRKGKLLRYKYEIDKEQLPLMVFHSLKTNYETRKIDESEIYIKENDTIYQIILDRTFNDEKIILSDSGEILTQIPYWE
ncbi:MAG TPA: hypothetical protein VFM60_04210 [Salinimicrobium sp.]|nr:hypothetical protein [Salinimicrobium sp.]